MKIAILAATGNIGAEVARLVSGEHTTTVLIGRSKNKLQQLGIRNAVIEEADIINAKEIEQATSGADALFCLVPPMLNVPSLKDFYEQATAATVHAVQQNNIKRVVLVSTLGADMPGSLGTISFVGDTEKALNKTQANVASLRPGYFMENLLLQIENIRKGFFSFTYDPSHAMPFISTDDIAVVAAKYLTGTDWPGKQIVNIMGPENLTLTEVAEKLSKTLQKEIRYQQSSIADAVTQLKFFGANDVVQKEFADLFLALGDKNGIYSFPRKKENFTLTTLEFFIEKKLKKLL